ncbi:Corticotropin-releasing factor receptor 2 [Halocaridina rubra]|uniref:Corticotropin-releasing factor receptor 2 n=1 Tax=Halocaridina rubra TaxID=373956 RepID=A0AAN8ZY89_HALRR
MDYYDEDDVEISDLTDGGIVDEHEIKEYSDDFGLPPTILEKINSPEFHEFFKESDLLNTTDDDIYLMKCFEKYIKSLEVSDHAPEACPVRFDGVSCWPETSQGSLAVIPCFEHFNEVEYEPSGNNATRFCHINGSWSNISFYGMCMDAEVTNTTDEEPNAFLAKNAIFYSGYALTLVAVAVALWIFLTFKDLRCLRNTIHTNLLFTYFLLALSWIAFQTVQHHLQEELECVFYATIQYFMITNFMWMFIEGSYLYMLVVRPFEVEKIRLRSYVLIGWGVPIPIILTWALVKSHARLTVYTAQTDEELEAVGLEPEDILGTLRHACPLLVNSPVDWVNKISVLVLLSVNIVFLLRVMWVLITKLRSHDNVETQGYRKATKALLVLTPLLGITYMLVLTVPYQLDHVHAVLLSTQGFWVAMLYCFFNSEVRNSVRQHFRRWKADKGIDDRRFSSKRNDSIGISIMPKIGKESNGGNNYGYPRESLTNNSSTPTTAVISEFANNPSNGYVSARTASPTFMKRQTIPTSLISYGDQESIVPLRASTKYDPVSA